MKCLWLGCNAERPSCYAYCADHEAEYNLLRDRPKMFKTGQVVEVRSPAHPYRRGGFVDNSYIIPAETHVMRITRVTRGGDRLALRRPDNSGFAIVVSEWLAVPGRTIKVVSDAV